MAEHWFKVGRAGIIPLDSATSATTTIDEVTAALLGRPLEIQLHGTPDKTYHGSTGIVGLDGFISRTAIEVKSVGKDVGVAANGIPLGVFSEAAHYVEARDSSQPLFLTYVQQSDRQIEVIELSTDSLAERTRNRLAEREERAAASAAPARAAPPEIVVPVPAPIREREPEPIAPAPLHKEPTPPKDTTAEDMQDILVERLYERIRKDYYDGERKQIKFAEGIRYDSDHIVGYGIAKSLAGFTTGGTAHKYMDSKGLRKDDGAEARNVLKVKLWRESAPGKTPTQSLSLDELADLFGASEDEIINAHNSGVFNPKHEYKPRDASRFKTAQEKVFFEVFDTALEKAVKEYESETPEQVPPRVAEPAPRVPESVPAVEPAPVTPAPPPSPRSVPSRPLLEELAQAVFSHLVQTGQYTAEGIMLGYDAEHQQLVAHSQTLTPSSPADIPLLAVTPHQAREGSDGYNARYTSYQRYVNEVYADAFGHVPFSLHQKFSPLDVKFFGLYKSAGDVRIRTYADLEASLGIDSALAHRAVEDGLLKKAKTVDLDWPSINNLLPQLFPIVREHQSVWYQELTGGAVAGEAPSEAEEQRIAARAATIDTVVEPDAPDAPAPPHPAASAASAGRKFVLSDDLLLTDPLRYLAQGIERGIRYQKLYDPTTDMITLPGHKPIKSGDVPRYYKVRELLKTRITDGAFQQWKGKEHPLLRHHHDAPAGVMMEDILAIHLSDLTDVKKYLDVEIAGFFGVPFEAIQRLQGQKYFAAVEKFAKPATPVRQRFRESFNLAFDTMKAGGTLLGDYVAAESANVDSPATRPAPAPSPALSPIPVPPPAPSPAPAPTPIAASIDDVLVSVPAPASPASARPEVPAPATSSSTHPFDDTYAMAYLATALRHKILEKGYYNTAQRRIRFDDQHLYVPNMVVEYVVAAQVTKKAVGKLHEFVNTHRLKASGLGIAASTALKIKLWAEVDLKPEPLAPPNHAALYAILGPELLQVYSKTNLFTPESGTPTASDIKARQREVYFKAFDYALESLTGRTTVEDVVGLPKGTKVVIPSLEEKVASPAGEQAPLAPASAAETTGYTAPAPAGTTPSKREETPVLVQPERRSGSLGARITPRAEDGVYQYRLSTAPKNEEEAVALLVAAYQPEFSRRLFEYMRRSGRFAADQIVLKGNDAEHAYGVEDIVLTSDLAELMPPQVTPGRINAAIRQFPDTMRKAVTGEGYHVSPFVAAAILYEPFSWKKSDGTKIPVNRIMPALLLDGEKPDLQLEKYIREYMATEKLGDQQLIGYDVFSKAYWKLAAGWAQAMHYDDSRAELMKQVGFLDENQTMKVLTQHGVPADAGYHALETQLRKAGKTLFGLAHVNDVEAMAPRLLE
ncbi:MAG: hypothetical protein Q7R76_02810 [Candidatus Woesearchaeota archaeon]|nr:hypothetical protein [Candidatus Woesearchaeota archaeon]